MPRPGDRRVVNDDGGYQTWTGYEWVSHPWSAPVSFQRLGQNSPRSYEITMDASYARAMQRSMERYYAQQMQISQERFMPEQDDTRRDPSNVLGYSGEVTATEYRCVMEPASPHLYVMAGATVGDVRRQIISDESLNRVVFQNGRVVERQRFLRDTMGLRQDAQLDVEGRVVETIPMSQCVPAPPTAPAEDAGERRVFSTDGTLRPIIYDNDERCWLVMHPVEKAQARQIFKGCPEVRVIRIRGGEWEIWRDQVMKKKKKPTPSANYATVADAILTPAAQEEVRRELGIGGMIASDHMGD